MPSITSLAMVVPFIATALAGPIAARAGPLAPRQTLPSTATRSSQCASKGATGHIEWGVYVVNTTMPSDQGSGSWGGGFLDNINGKAGCAPTSWQAQVDDADPQGVAATFNTPDFCTVNQISDAIHAASSEADDGSYGSGQWVYCEGDTLNDLFDDTGKIIEGLTEELGQAAGLLSGFAK